MLTGAFVCSTSKPSTGYGAQESVRLKVPAVFFFSPDRSVSSWLRAFSLADLQREERSANANQSCGSLEEPEPRQGTETRSNTVTENLLQQAKRRDGKETWNCIWSDCEICLTSRGILIKEEKNYEFCLLHAGRHYMKPGSWGLQHLGTSK